MLNLAILMTLTSKLLLSEAPSVFFIDGDADRLLGRPDATVLYRVLKQLGLEAYRDRVGRVFDILAFTEAVSGLAEEDEVLITTESEGREARFRENGCNVVCDQRNNRVLYEVAAHFTSFERRLRGEWQIQESDNNTLNMNPAAFHSTKQSPLLMLGSNAPLFLLRNTEFACLVDPRFMQAYLPNPGYQTELSHLSRRPRRHGSVHVGVEEIELGVRTLHPVDLIAGNDSPVDSLVTLELQNRMRDHMMEFLLNEGLI